MQKLIDATLNIDHNNSTQSLLFQMYHHLNIVSDHPHIPEEAFLFVPQTNSSEPRDDFRIGFQKTCRRLLFQGWAVGTYSKFELQQLQLLEQYLTKNSITLDSRWDTSWRLRFLISTGYNLKKCVKDMQIFIKYQQSVRQLSFTKNVAKYIRQGVFYVAGRDSHYRPILVFDVEKTVQTGMSEDELIETQTYFFQYVIRNLLIPGQVENWVSVIDVAEIGLFSLISTLKKSSSFLSDTYRCRMFVCYVLRVPTSISFVWGILKKFIDEETVRKINFFDDQKIPPLLQFCNPSQLQVKFGGSLPNISSGHFWPPREVSPNYKCQKQSVKLLTKQEYSNYYKNKVLYNTKFHQQNILMEGTSQFRDNFNLHLIKHIEKDFKLQLQNAIQDQLDYQSEVKPYCNIRPSLKYTSLLSKHHQQQIQITNRK